MSRYSSDAENRHPDQHDGEIWQDDKTIHADLEGVTQRGGSLEPRYEQTSQYEESYHANDEEMSQYGKNPRFDDEEMSQYEDNYNSKDEGTPQPDPNGAMLNPLREELSKEGGKAIFACGGSLPVVSQPDAAQSPGSQHSSISAGSEAGPPTTEPVTIRWDPPAADELARHAKLVLPLEPETQDNLERLINSTERASFGYQGKDTYDETYRKALKMDTSAFSTTFDPYSLGIIDTIAQVLLPTMRQASVYRAVKAELYKLNVSTATFSQLP